MKYRRLGRTGWQVSSVSLGGWGTVDDRDSLADL